MNRVAQPYYSSPSLKRVESEAVGNITVNADEFAVVLGSDLVLATGSADDEGLHAFDSDGNHLACIALLGQGVTLTEVLPIAVQAARALFPNHLLTEI